MKWHGVGITDDLTKIEYTEYKFQEGHLGREAKERNNQLSNGDKIVLD